MTVTRTRAGCASALLAAVIGAAGCGSGGETRTVPVEAVATDAFRRELNATGFLEARDATPLTAPITLDRPATIAWLAEDGVYVGKGEVVVEFDPTPLEKDLDDGVAERDSQRNRIVSTSVLGEQQRSNLERDAAMADRELAMAREFSTHDELVFKRHEIIEAEIDENLALKKKTHAEETRGVRDRLNRVEIDILKIGERKAETKIDRARQGLEAMSISAPHDGIFVLKNQWGGQASVGETVWRGQQVGELPALEAMEAEIWVLEADAGGLEEGIEAGVIVESDPGRRYAARVKSVSKLPARRWRQNPAQFFKLKLEFLDATAHDAPRLKPGARVRATLVLDAQDEALTVPRSAVFLRDGKRWVRVQRGTAFEDVEVELGPANLGRVVVEQGLEPGDRVALGDPAAAGALGESGDAGGPLAGSGASP